MALIKCEHCSERIPPRQMPLHLKRCIAYRRKLKAGILPVADNINSANGKKNSGKNSWPKSQTGKKSVNTQKSK